MRNSPTWVRFFVALLMAGSPCCLSISSLRKSSAKITERPDLTARIPRSDVEELFRTLLPYPPVRRDPDDDVLIAHAIAARADYVVSWDMDLRDLG